MHSFANDLENASNIYDQCWFPFIPSFIKAPWDFFHGKEKVDTISNVFIVFFTPFCGIQVNISKLKSKICLYVAMPSARFTSKSVSQPSSQKTSLMKFFWSWTQLLIGVLPPNQRKISLVAWSLAKFTCQSSWKFMRRLSVLRYMHTMFCQ